MSKGLLKQNKPLPMAPVMMGKREVEVEERQSYIEWSSESDDGSGECALSSLFGVGEGCLDVFVASVKERRELWLQFWIERCAD